MSVLIEHPTRILSFTGKGGVGKTSAARATAIRLADAGKRVPLVSTDPASNLDDSRLVSPGPDRGGVCDGEAGVLRDGAAR